jgi:hypothetical protein
MSNELVVFTHNDLDALGCMLNIEYKWPQVKKKYFHTNYANIDKIVQEIVDYQKANGSTHLIMPDVSFSDNKESLKILYNAFEHCTHIDHHMYPDGFWDEFPNMKVQWDKTKSATLICNEYLGNKGKNSNLDKLSMIIDVYDIWQDQHPAFSISQDMNEYFWHCANQESIEIMMKRFISNDYGLPIDYSIVTEAIRDKYENAIDSYEKRNLIHRADKITIAFVNDWFNQILIREMQDGQEFVIGANSNGIIKIRINQRVPYTVQQLNKIREILTGNPEYGHLHAFTYKVNGTVDFNSIMEEVKKVTETIGSVCNE